ncbi:MAG: cytochrome P460 family protein [Myxococcales bacterium]|nr:cytochrome P460 family protein [Myxococcales bacterium]
MARVSALVISLALCAAGCDSGEEEPSALLPADYAATYTEVRDCRTSGDHDLHHVRILADPAALAPYRDRDQPFPVGSLVVKEEFDFGDLDCTGPIVQWTVMQKLEDGSAPDQLDWTWQKIDTKRRVVTQNDTRCTGCHLVCGASPEGYEGTCAVP